MTPPLAHDTGIRIDPDPARVVARLFVPGLEDVGPTGSRAGATMNRLLQLDEDEVRLALRDVIPRFEHRHRDLLAIFEEHATSVLTLVSADVELSEDRRLLIGACFTHEYTVEGASVANPSIVRAPHARTDGSTPFVMSVRGIGEGHRSSIGFRTGTVGADGSVAIDTPSPYVRAVSGSTGLHHRSVFHAKLDSLGVDFERMSAFLSNLPTTFDDAELNAAIELVTGDLTQHRLDPEVVGYLAGLSRWSYDVEFPDDTDVSERILWPHAPPEYHGMEDARFVQFTDDDGVPTYYATYTAFDRSDISMQLLHTDDFRRFSSTPMAGDAAIGKGLAIFPRKVNGTYLALTRSDRESNGIASSTDLRFWPTSAPLQSPTESWEILQMGNCGSPVETPFGWLVLTHGVGPMRTYCIGAILLDLEQPQVMIGRLRDPLIRPTGDQRDGYVPNVVYSCGSLLVDETLVVPYGIGDQRIAVATFDVADVIGAMSPV